MNVEMRGHSPTFDSFFNLNEIVILYVDSVTTVKCECWRVDEEGGGIVWGPIVIGGVLSEFSRK
jgi:hypothetical protein